MAPPGPLLGRVTIGVKGGHNQPAKSIFVPTNLHSQNIFYLHKFSFDWNRKALIIKAISELCFHRDLYSLCILFLL